VPLGLLGGAAVAGSGLALSVLGALGLGRATPDRGGNASPPVVEVARSAAPVAGAAPSTLAALAARIPQEGDQIRVERYGSEGSERRFAVYVAGTRSPLGFGGREPFDMSSNVQLYAGRSSASYESVVSALRAAGARQVVLTCGRRGAFFDDGATVRHAPAIPVDVVDTCGAGDSFIASFLASFRFGGLDAAEALRTAAAAAAGTCLHVGGFPQEPRPIPGWLPAKYAEFVTPVEGR